MLSRAFIMLLLVSLCGCTNPLFSKNPFRDRSYEYRGSHATQNLTLPKGFSDKHWQPHYAIPAVVKTDKHPAKPLSLIPPGCCGKLKTK